MMPFLLFLLASVCLAQNTLTPAEKKAGWRLLFDGKTFHNWQDPTKMTPAGDSWSIAGGALKSTSHPKLREDLVTADTFDNFELTWEWKIAPGGNSGLKYAIQDFIPIPGAVEKKHKKFEDAMAEVLAAPRLPRAVVLNGGQMYVAGFEYQMIDDTGHKDAQRGPLYQTAALYSMIPRTGGIAKSIGEYNLSRIVKKGDHIEHWLNGEKVLDSSLADPEIARGLEKRWTSASPIYRMLTGRPQKKCPISLQNHNDEAWFRSLKIKPLN